MADKDKNLPSEETLQQMLSVQGAEIETRRRELEVRAADLDNHKAVALASIEAEKEDRAGEREAFTKESRRNKIFVSIFVSILVSMLLLFIMGMVWLGQSAAIFDLLKEFMKYVLGGFGGAGLTLVYLSFKKEA